MLALGLVQAATFNKTMEYNNGTQTVDPCANSTVCEDFASGFANAIGMSSGAIIAIVISVIAFLIFIPVLFCCIIPVCCAAGAGAAARR